MPPGRSTPLLDLPEGRGQIRLGDIADFPAAAVGPNQLMRENVRRRQSYDKRNAIGAAARFIRRHTALITICCLIV